MLRLPRLLKPEPATPEQMRRWGARGCAERGLTLPPMAGGAGYALVGTAGGAAVSGGTITPSWGTGESRTAGNLLIAFVWSAATNTVPSAPSGWTLGTSGLASAGRFCAIYYKIAAGGDATPTFTGTSLNGSLAEFSGNAISPLDQHNGSVSGSFTGLANPSADALAGELVLYIVTLSSGVTPSLNNGATATSVVATAAANYGYGVTTSNGTADALSVSTNSNVTSSAIASFLVSGGQRIRMMV